MEKNINTKKISLLLLICLVGFPQVSETIFTPSLTNIASAYGVTMNVAQLTLSIYFLSFAFGVFFWGIISDFIGRRSAMLYGILVYTIGCIICYISTDVNILFLGRFVQAFGASTGSVTTQTILREHYQGNERHTLFAQISAALAFTPALGPLIGGYIGQYFGFRAVFLTLVILGAGLLLWTHRKLPETMIEKKTHFNASFIFSIGKKMLFSRYTLIFCLLIGVLNGVLFSYYAEAPFIFIEVFGFSQSQYGFMGIVVACATILGALLSKKLLTKYEPTKIIRFGITFALLGSLFLLAISLIDMPLKITTILFILGIFITLIGTGLALPNCLSLALAKFSDVAGTAGAFLSLVYYIIVSLFTFVMGIIHNGSIMMLPLLFVGSFILLFIVTFSKEFK